MKSRKNSTPKENSHHFFPYLTILSPTLAWCLDPYIDFHPSTVHVRLGHLRDLRRFVGLLLGNTTQVLACHDCCELWVLVQFRVEIHFLLGLGIHMLFLEWDHGSNHGLCHGGSGGL
jgi:hypothetical protein